MPNIVNNTTFVSLMDLLAPHPCRCCGGLGTTLCERCKNYIIMDHENICPNCKSINPTGICPNCPNLPPTFIVGKRKPVLGSLIHDFKYNSVRALARPLAELTDSVLPIIDGKVCVIPLPTIDKHIRARGLDHTYLIARSLVKLRGKNYQTRRILLRRTNSVQVGSSKAERKLQATKAYEINKKSPINPDITYILFDDVWTTGASMKSALEILRSAGATKIILLILALSTYEEDH